jgi:hypothetical protein
MVAKRFSYLISCEVFVEEKLIGIQAGMWDFMFQIQTKKSFLRRKI